MNLLSDEDVTVQDVDGKKVILVDVPRASRMDRPVFLDGNDRNTFRRQNDGDYKCDPEEIRSMISDSLSGATDRVPIRTSEIEDLDRNTIKSYRNSLRTLKPEHPWNRCDDTEFLRRIGAAVRDGDTVRPTMAGLLMFGESFLIQSEMVNYHLDYRQYHEGDDWSYRLSSGDGEWSGNVFDFYIAVMNHARTTIGRPFAISDDAKEFQIVVTGELTQDATIVQGGDNGGSDGLGLTDYLLIVLVILIVIMAIIVALRLMRS